MTDGQLFGRNRMRGGTRAAAAAAISAVFASLTSGAAAAQDAAKVFRAFEPNAAHPFGRMNPEAPEGVQDYAFMIGEWICDDRARNAGDWTEFTSQVRGEWFLNGHGILNHSYTPTSAAAMTYEFDPESGEWLITNSIAPGFRHTDWIGRKESHGMVAGRPDVTSSGDPMTLEITFHDITSDTFRWKLEAVTDAGVYLVREMACRRTAGPS